MRRDRSDRRGFLLVSAVVALGLLAVVGVIMTQSMTASSQNTARSDRRLRGDQVLVDVANNLIAKSFESNFSLCKKTIDSDPAVWPSKPLVIGKCAGPDGHRLTDGATLAQDPLDPRELELRRNWKGEEDPAGYVCVELSNCLLRAHGHLLEMTFSGVWTDPDPKVELVRRTLSVRKVRW